MVFNNQQLLCLEVKEVFTTRSIIFSLNAILSTRQSYCCERLFDIERLYLSLLI